MFPVRRFRKTQWLWIAFLFYVGMLTYYLFYKKDLSFHIKEAESQVKVEDILYKVKNLVTELTHASNIHTKLSILLDVEERKYKELLSQQEKLRKTKVLFREPTLRYEEIRRRIKKTIQHLFGHVFYEGANLELFSYYDTFMRNYRRSLLTDCDQWRTVDGYENWRHVEAKELTDLVQKRIYSLRYPEDCNTRKIIIENIPEDNCEFACQIHFLVNSLSIAYGTKRAIALQNNKWQYFNDGFEKYFEPISGKCNFADIYINGSRSEMTNDDDAIILTKQSLEKNANLIPTFLPSDLIYRITRLHGEPTAFWASQFLRNIFQLSVSNLQRIDKFLYFRNLTKPFVGLHIKRGSTRSLDDYMDDVENYFRTIELTGKTFPRNVFLATDDPNIILSALMKYPMYNMVVNSHGTDLVANPKTRISKGALDAIVADLHILSLSNHLVCSFSSEICRLAYELMQTKHLDASDRITSYNHLYYYQNENLYFEVFRTHQKRYSNETNGHIGELLKASAKQYKPLAILNIDNETTQKIIPAFKIKRITMKKNFD